MSMEVWRLDPDIGLFLAQINLFDFACSLVASPMYITALPHPLLFTSGHSLILVFATQLSCRLLPTLLGLCDADLQTGQESL